MRHVSGEPGGLRELKKRRTRTALLHSALELFTTQGFEATTIDQIAEPVEVSQRTFFRYFASKEEVAFAVPDTVESHFFDAFRARPPAEPPMTALRRAMRATWETFGESVEGISPALHMRMYQLIESTPALLAVLMCRSAAMEERLAEEIARREGLDLDADPRPRVLVAAFTGVMRATGRIWGAGGDTSAASLRRITEEHLDRLGPALVTAWDRPEPGAGAAGET
ncbi:TetR family transcriptional regulator [Streptomyces sp. Ru87]|nr:TetR family transcriptional regulator [Streptomyces sp. Ru87]